MGLSGVKHPSSDLMTRIFKTSQISGQKDTVTAKCTRGLILQIFHLPKPDGPTPWQEAGHKHTNRPERKENSLLSPRKAPPGITHRMCKEVSQETLLRGLLRQDSDSTVQDSVGKTNSLEATMNNEGTKVEKSLLPLAGLLGAAQEREL